MNSAIPKPPWQRGAGLQSFLTPTFSKGWQDRTPPALVELKNRILPFEEQGNWEILKKMVNPYEIVYTHEHEEFHPSLSLIKPLSRSYFKMIEILDVLQFYESLPKQNPKIRTAHIAEGPGGFIQALCDTVERTTKHLAIATAMTLKPTDQRVPGWRRAANFLQRHKQVKLIYGEDGTGDIYKSENQAAFVEAVKPGAHLFTADGGFDFSVNYQIQEQRVFHLLVSSALIGLQSVSPDGAFVLKLFDTYSDATKILVAILARSFREWCIYKPALSRPCNSERYFLGRSYRGVNHPRLGLLKELFARSLVEEYPVSAETILLPEELAYIDAQSELSTTSQTNALERALFYADHPQA